MPTVVAGGRASGRRWLSMHAGVRGRVDAPGRGDYGWEEGGAWQPGGRMRAAVQMKDARGGQGWDVCGPPGVGCVGRPGGGGNLWWRVVPAAAVASGDWGHGGMWLGEWCDRSEEVGDVVDVGQSFFFLIRLPVSGWIDLASL